MSPNDPLPIFRPSRYLLPTLSSIARRSSNTPKTWCKAAVAAEVVVVAHAVVLGGWQSAAAAAAAATAAAAAARGRRRGNGEGTTRDGCGGRHCPAQYPATVRW